MARNYDFSGWATRNNLRCSDGRTIRKNAFIDDDGATVPLVWNHQHNDPSNVLGHALLENRDDGVYAYCTLNDTPTGQNVREMVKHGDVSALSIYANQLKQKGGDVIHGAIREVSLVLAGANPGAFIDTIIAHGDDSDEHAIIYSGFDLELAHAEEPEEKKMEPVKEEKTKEEPKMAEKTVKDVFDELTEEQKNVVYALIGQAVEDAKASKEDDVKHNVFDYDEMNQDEYLSHSEMEAIFSDGKRYGSLKDSVLAHGIENIEYLFPDATDLNKAPEWIKREDGWVSQVMSATHHSPFSRIKSMFADITEDDARALGYFGGSNQIDPSTGKPYRDEKGNLVDKNGNRALKKEEVFSLLKRTTTPTTIYKKQKLDRDDVIDITDFDVVAWLKTEMRMMLNEEIARAVLFGDGRLASSDDKINEQCIRPVWTDADLFTIKQKYEVAASDTVDDQMKKFIRTAAKARKMYKGSGNLVLYTTEDVLTDIMLMEDKMGRVIYDTEEKVKNALRVSKIVTVPVMEGLTRVVGEETRTLVGLFVNLADYNIGADKGGAVNMFDDFDIDYNAQKYLIETRCSGALVKPYSAIAIESVPATA